MAFKNLVKLEIYSNRVFGLDILRAIAIILVILVHGNFQLPPKIADTIDSYLFDGVSIFFVLSGFLIGGIIIKILQKGNVSFKSIYNFWTRRWLRTLPNYIFVLTLLIVLNLCLVKEFKVMNMMRYYVFLQNISTVPKMFLFNESWSLSVEEWFYLLVPSALFLLIGIFKIKDKKAIVWLAITLIFTVTLFRYYRFLTEPKPSNRAEWGILFYYPVITRIDSIMYGVIGAYAAINFNPFWIKYKVHFLLAGICLFIADKMIFLSHQEYSNIYNCVFSFTTLSVATLMLLPYLSELKSGQGFLYKAITYISLTSYSMYLINNTLINQWGINFLISFLSHAKIYPGINALYFIKYFFFLSATFIGSIILYKYLELPFMRLRKKEND